MKIMNEKFVFLSESCIPLHKLDTIYINLIRHPQTYMSWCRPWWSHRHTRWVRSLPTKHQWANQEWVILNRRHALCLVKDDRIIRKISKYDNDQESWPSSVLSVFNLLEEVENKTTTYVNWSLPAEDKWLPRQFWKATPENLHLLLEAKKQGFLFARKVMEGFPEQALLALIHADCPEISFTY